MAKEKGYQPQESLRLSETIYRTPIKGLLYIDRPVYRDERGFFTEIASIPEIQNQTGEEFRPLQINHSRSVTGVVRGLHAEGWNKLVTVSSGLVFCALADIRPESNTFGKVVTLYMGYSGEVQGGALYIQKGIANSFCVVEGPADYVYVVDSLFESRDTSMDRAVNVFDPDLNIPWPISSELLMMSDRDRDGKTMREVFPDKFLGKKG
jgi:dTDP-4-dehydrorhamnose 3,5-epimerase